MKLWYSFFKASFHLTLRCLPQKHLSQTSAHTLQIFLFFIPSHEADFHLYVEDKVAVLTPPPGPEHVAADRNRLMDKVQGFLESTQAVVKVKGQGQRGCVWKGNRVLVFGLRKGTALCWTRFSEPEGGQKDGRRARSTGAAFCMSAPLHGTFGNPLRWRVQLCVCMYGVCVFSLKKRTCFFIYFSKSRPNLFCISPKVLVALIIQRQMGSREDGAADKLDTGSLPPQKHWS